MTTSDSMPKAAVPANVNPKYGRKLEPESEGFVLLDEFTFDPIAAKAEHHRITAAIAKAAAAMRKVLALRVIIAVVAIANLPLFLLNSGWFVYAIALAVVVAVHVSVSWLNKHEPRIRHRGQQELRKHSDNSANYRRLRDGVKYVIDKPARINEQLYLELLAAKRVALHMAVGTHALLDTSDDSAWKVRIIREIPGAAKASLN
ncbi:hypothetical protein [Arthrobacter sp. M4]|uniref:hypothetical protein n=1 Tax=Arthrobacter sp. M4 TaxID=218160 RepID=UPI001CDBC2D6|nr:hypothetical protein [Arthrobacter sp. M4]MCA4133971.1 hypothetical protein [Arthrobacter sp. M4]